MRKTSLLILVLLATTALGRPVLAQDSSKSANKTSDESNKASLPAEHNSPVAPPAGYTVGVDDELLISVWHEPELSQTVVVRPDGMITLPLLNDVKVVGLSTGQLQALVTEKLKNLVNEPQVTIVVKNIRSLKVFLVGNVGKQGMYPLNSGLTALQLITEGGGLSPFAKSGSIYILRTVNGKQTRIGFDYKKALRGKGQDPELRSGDMVVIP